MRKWFVRLQGDVYAMSIYPKEDTFSSAREFVLAWLGVDRLPDYTEIWSRGTDDNNSKE